MEYFLRMLVTKLICNQDEVQLGLARLKLIETVFYLIKNNVLSFRKIMMQGVDGRKLMAGLLLLCNHFQYNNMLHNEVVKILDPICRLPTMAGLVYITTHRYSRAFQNS